MASFFKRYAPLLVSGLAAAQTAIEVNLATTYQTIDGFGFSQAFGRASEFQALAAAPQKQGLDLLFDTTVGAGMTIIRNRIGSNGTGDSIEPTSPGSPTANATYVWDDNDEGQVWFSQQAISYGVSTIYADAWSAPGFMKTNGEDIDGGYLCGTTGHTCSSGDWRQAYANFLVEYINLYASAGIPITYVGFLNEPDLTTSYSSMLITISNPVEVTSFVPILYDTLNSAGLGSVTIACCDMTGWSDAQAVTAALAAADSISPYIGLLTSHMYGGDPTSLIDSSLTDLPPVWMTEGADLSDAWCTTWYSSGGLCEGLTWAEKISTGILSANLSAYIYWEGLEVDEPSASSYLVAVLDGETATASGRLWAFAMWSRFIRPGAVRVGTSGTISNVAIGAFENTDGSVVVVFTNSGSTTSSAAVSFSGFTPSAASAWLTDNTHSVNSTTITLSGGVATVSLPSYSVVTVKLTGAAGGGGGTTTSKMWRYRLDWGNVLLFWDLHV
ncbi:family 5 glycoside hydrolase [Cryphonectria parasitica EP155]|uniref:Family 5 glycoside hydrolase n=1 Tax=Cryphonectria parasitica (strain ATCC 38755 / EP155) TaxID=660469 RepID=A0A9P4Y0E6_CRYP1|nr:family 5 glycoside hydrolase [Cryphonectria parasitica EP155]KAF3764228.1 family 5 glycoside hydrolase [Cryphonectria parasitica EP155]